VTANAGLRITQRLRLELTASRSFQALAGNATTASGGLGQLLIGPGQNAQSGRRRLAFARPPLTPAMKPARRFPARR
jgi:hypothetical protein